MYNDMFNDYINFLYRRRPRPPFGGFPFGPPFGPPSGPPSGGGAPTTPPPSYTPERPSTGPGLYAIDPGAIRRCRYRFVYLWLEDGREFWAYLVFVGRTSISGYRWTGRRWRYFGTDTKNIESFECY